MVVGLLGPGNLFYLMNLFSLWRYLDEVKAFPFCACQWQFRKWEILKEEPFKQMGARTAKLLCLQQCGQVNMPKPSTYGAVTSSRPELTCVRWLREQEQLLGLPASLRVDMTKTCPREDVLLATGSCEKETSLCVVTLLDFVKVP